MPRVLSVWCSRLRAMGGYVFALVAGLLAAWGVHTHIQTREREIANQAAVVTQARIVAATALSAGERLRPEHLAVREIPEAWLPPQSFDPEQTEHVWGARLATDMQAGETLLRIHLKPEEPSLSERVLSGRRAVTLPIEEIHAVSGLLHVDDLVDMYVSFLYQGQQLTAPLVQGLRVLAVGGTSDTPTSITFDAPEQDAIKLVAARYGGSLTAMVRHRDDVSMTKNMAAGDLAALMGLEKPSEPRPVTVAILYGDRIDNEREISLEKPSGPSAEMWLPSDPGDRESPPDYTLHSMPEER